jgi:ribosomal protein L9
MRANVLPWLVTGLMTIVAVGAGFAALYQHTQFSQSVEAQHALVRMAEEQRQKVEASEQEARKQALALRDTNR